MKANHHPAWAGRIAQVFEGAGQPLWLVGGAVRNPLMGLPISDVDMCGPALPQEVCDFCEGSGVRAVLRQAHFGTVELHVHDGQERHMAEYTTFREDSYRCGHRPEMVKFAKDLSVDALRRDFSVNALYQRCTAQGMGNIQDPTGGLVHMEQGVLHTVTKDPDQVLKDDGLRILRAARFQAELGLVPTRDLLQSAAIHVALLADIAAERLRDELEKVLLADLRYPMLSRKCPATGSGLATIHQIGAWPYLFGNLGYNDVAISALSKLALPPDVPVLASRLALLFWKEEESKVREALQWLRFSVRDQAWTAALIGFLRSTAAGKATAFEAVRAGLPVLCFAQSALEALGMLAEGQRTAALRQRLLQENAPFSLKELAVHGEDLLPLCQQAGKSPAMMGTLLQDLWQAAVEGRLANKRSSLLSAASQWLASSK